jgi:hypothetical protein
MKFGVGEQSGAKHGGGAFVPVFEKKALPDVFHPETFSE